MNLTEMLALVRIELRDEEALNYRWTDDELEWHIAHALKEFSEAIPLPTKATIQTTSGSSQIDVAALTGRIMVEAVEYPAGQFPAQYCRFSLWGDCLTLLAESVLDGSDCYIYYGQLHTLNAVSSTIPPAYEELVAGGASGYAAEAWALYAVNQVNNGGEKTSESFSAWGHQKLKLFRSELKKLGRRNRVRTSQLYIPFYPIQTQTMDPGP